MLLFLWVLVIMSVVCLSIFVAVVEGEDGEVREAEFAGFVMEGEEEKKDD